MKKVLILYKFLPQYRKEFFDQLKVELSKNNVELELIYGKNKNSDKLKNDEVEIEWAHYIPNKTLKIWRTELIWQPCLKYIKGKDLIIVENANKLLINYCLMFIRHFSKYKLAFWGHGRNLQDKKDSLRNRFKFFFTNKCDWWFGYTLGTKDILIEQKFPDSKITIVQNAIDTQSLKKYYLDIKNSEILELKNQLGIKNWKTGIYCGAMYPGKKLDFILDTCLKIKQEIPEFRMIFIGAGIDAIKIIDASKSCDWILYVGPKFKNDRVKYFKISIIQIMPYYVGLGVLDSFAMETPMITTSNSSHGPEIEYIKNGINGIITNDDLADYSQAIIDTLKSEKYIELIQGCKLSAEIYTIEAMVENFKNGILSCLNTTDALKLVIK
jgi:glycosyltransferase involved in cell wall biosynthesis